VHEKEAVPELCAMRAKAFFWRPMTRLSFPFIHRTMTFRICWGPNVVVNFFTFPGVNMKKLQAPSHRSIMTENGANLLGSVCRFPAAYHLYARPHTHPLPAFRESRGPLTPLIRRCVILMYVPPLPQRCTHPCDTGSIDEEVVWSQGGGVDSKQPNFVRRGN
jgi:hypothetical protein